MNKCKKRIAAMLLAVCLSGSMVSTALAAPLSEAALGSWKNTAAMATKKQDRETARTWVYGELNRIATETQALLDATSEPDVGKILSGYGTYLAYMHWVCNNISVVHEDGSQITLFEGPDVTDKLQPTRAMQIALSLQKQIVDKGLVKNVKDTANGVFTQTTAVTYTLPTEALLFQTSGLVGEQGYGKALGALITNYCDSGVLGVLAAKAGVVGIGTYAELSTQVTTGLKLEGGDTTVASPLAAEFKEQLMPYLTVYNQVTLALTNSYGRSLGDLAMVVSGESKLTKGYQNPLVTTTLYTVSKTTEAIYKCLFSSEGSGITDTTVPDATINVLNGALSMMSNARIENGTVKLADGEEAELTTIGYVILAAGSTYDPFSSVAGNDAYIKTIEKFLPNGAQKEKAIKIIHNALNFKKPLMVAIDTGNAWSSSEEVAAISLGNYREAYLVDLISKTESGVKAYAVVKGKMETSRVDSSTWEYTNNEADITTSDTYAGLDALEEGNPTEDIKVSDTAGTTSSSTTVTSNAGTVTVGSPTMMASSEQVTEPVMFSSTATGLFNNGRADNAGLPFRIGGLTTMVVQNAAQDAKNNRYIERASREMLFINGLGDIVLSDNTIVLPAVANPILYEYSTPVAEDNPIEVEKGYYPYTAAFMNHYPSVTLAGGTLKGTGNSDIDKLMLRANKGAPFTVRIKSENGDSRVWFETVSGIACCNVKANCFSTTANPEDIVSPLANVVSKGVNAWGEIGKALTDGIPYLINNKNAAILPPWENVFSTAIKLSIMDENSNNFFPITNGDKDLLDTYLSIAGPITTSTLRYLSEVGESTGTYKSAGTFRIESYVKYFMGESLLGTQYAETMMKNNKISYDDLVADTGGRLLNLIVQITNSALDNLGQVDGVLSIKNAYENRFFNAIVAFIQQFYLLFAVAILILVAVKFLQGHFDTLYVLFLALIAVAGFEVYANWMPTMLPNIYNLVTNDVVEPIAWNTLTVKAESYKEVYQDSSRKDPTTGAPKPYTATITLYKLTNAEMGEISARHNINIKKVRQGEPVYLDETAGIFVQGDQIKMSIDKLFANNSIRGLYQSDWDKLGSNETTGLNFIPPIDETLNNNPYSVQLTHPYVSLDAHYMPFAHFERAFMSNLNTFANIFRVERVQYSYGSDLYKDAFLVNAFANSGIFLQPNNRDVLKNNILENSITGSNTATTDEIVDLCERYFNPQEDWLNLRSVFAVPSDAMRNSLWGQMMQDQGMYSEDWTMDMDQQEKVTDLIKYINDQTKRFVYRNTDQILFCSDENAIKLISLYATTCFTHYISQFGKWMYPNYINSSDISLSDVLYGAMTTMKDRNFAYDGNVVNTVALNQGVFGVIFILLIVIFSVIFVFCTTYLVPILYALFGVILVYKLLNDERSVGLVQGYGRVTLVTMALYTVYSFGLKLVKIGGYQWYGYLACALITMLCVYFLFFVVLAVVTDIGDLGNNTLKDSLVNGANKITGGAFQKLQASVLQVKNTNIQNNQGLNGYNRGDSIDEGGFIHSRRGMSAKHAGYAGYGRDDFYDEDSLKQVNRARFNRNARNVLDTYGRSTRKTKTRK